MKKTNQILAGVAVVLLALSILSYRESLTRAERFERGQRFLPNLNPNEIASIGITKGDETVTLGKGGDNYTVHEAHRYPAKNEAVNRLLREVLELGLEKEVGRGEDLTAELELEPAGDATVDVVFKNSADQEMVHFRIGKPAAGGPGHYVQRLDGEDDGMIYLTSRSAYLSTGIDSFLKKELVDVSQSEIQRISGVDFVFDRDDEDRLELQGLAAGKKERTSETNRVKSILSRLGFDKVYLADDEEVRDLVFYQALRIDLKDLTGYVLSVASKDDRHFLRIAGIHNVDRIEISQESSDEELAEKADLLTRVDEIEEFNTFHGSWVYEISNFTAQKLELTRTDLIEDEST